MWTQQAQELKATRERLQLHTAIEGTSQRQLVRHEKGLFDQRLEAQAKSGVVANTTLAQRMALEGQHEKALAGQKLIAQEKAELVTNQSLAQRMGLQKQHEKGLFGQRLIAQEKSEPLSNRSLQQRMILQTQHGIDRLSKVQQLEQHHLVQRQNRELAHLQNVSDHKLLVQEKLDTLSNQSLAQRMLLQTQQEV